MTRGFTHIQDSLLPPSFCCFHLLLSGVLRICFRHRRYLGGANMNETMIGITGLLLLLLLFATGIELGFAMALIGFVGFGYLNGFDSALNLLARDFMRL